MAWREPCFREAARGEVVAGGRKLVGSAQRCEHGVILQHGSILIAGDQAPVLELQHPPESPSRPAHLERKQRLETPAPSGGIRGGGDGVGGRLEAAARAVTLHELLGYRPGIEEIADAVVAGFENLGGIRFAADSLAGDEQRRASRLSERYRSADWTWRR